MIPANDPDNTGNFANVTVKVNPGQPIYFYIPVDCPVLNPGDTFVFVSTDNNPITATYSGEYTYASATYSTATNRWSVYSTTIGTTTHTGT